MKALQPVVAGVIHAPCSCCADPRELVHHVQLGPTRMFCPQTHRTYLDRGDGIFQSDGQVLSAPEVEARAEATPASDLLSDRPTRTTEKTRISLERATFA
ncbi:MAG: hypothetical protein AB2A00_08245 [Myxococcota bacterium]